jgi:hypothetical protein
MSGRIVARRKLRISELLKVFNLNIYLAPYTATTPMATRKRKINLEM